jgi:glycosyltransferase involved in cell wall biosynthesis
MIPISICIPTHERYELLLESFDKVVKDDRVGEIVIVDDFSSEENYNDVRNAVKWMPKVKLYRNDKNLDCYRNKHEAISKATNEYCIILDSDNVIDKAFIDKIYQQEWEPETILAPDWAMPTFDYTEFSGLTVTRQNVADYMKKKFFTTCLNCMNYFVNRDKYMEVWDGSVDPVTADSIFQNYNWLKSGYKIKIVEGLRYFHRIHNGSHYQNNNQRTEKGFYEKIEQNLMELK